MKYISLRNFIDDILLIVRNNNISESEDLSRAQIAIWVKAYKNEIIKERLDEIKRRSKLLDDLEELVENDIILLKEVGPLELEDVRSKNEKPIFTKRTKDKLENIFEDSERSILSVHDQEGCVIQYMNHIRRHYHYNRRYTYGELTSYYDDGYIYIQGIQDQNHLRYIWVEAIYENSEDSNDEDDIELDEDDIKIPAWMIPRIKKNILANELSFMLNRPSDDSNNTTLSSVKPHGPQDDEK